MRPISTAKGRGDQMTFVIDPADKQRLTEFAEILDRSPSDLARKAIKEYLARRVDEALSK